MVLTPPAPRGPEPASEPGPRSLRPFRDALLAELDVPAADGTPKLRRLAAKLIELACAGSPSALAAILERLDGRPPPPPDEVAEPLRVIITGVPRWYDDLPDAAGAPPATAPPAAVEAEPAEGKL